MKKLCLLFVIVFLSGCGDSGSGESNANSPFRVISYTGSDGNSGSYMYNEKGQLNHMIRNEADGTSVQISGTYNSLGQLVRVDDTDDEVTTIKYDDNGNITMQTTTYADGSTSSIKYTYNSQGLLFQARGDGSIVTFVYNASGQATQALINFLNGSADTILVFLYNSQGQVTQIKNDGFNYTQNYTYNNLGQLTQTQTNAKGDINIRTYTYEEAKCTSSVYLKGMWEYKNFNDALCKN